MLEEISTNEIQVGRANELSLPTVNGFSFYRNGLELIDEQQPVSLETWRDAGMQLATFASALGIRTRAVQFALGDWLNIGENRYSEQWSQYIDDVATMMKCELHTLQVYMFVAKAIPPVLRRTELDWSHFKEIAYSVKEYDDREAWIDRCADEGMSVRELREAIKEENGEDDQTQITYLICPKCNKKSPKDKFEVVE